MTKTHVTKWGVGWVDNPRKDPGCLENQVPMLLKGAPACANEACSLVAPRRVLAEALQASSETPSDR